MKVSIIPSYKCSKHCNFCYLGNKVADQTLIKPHELANCLGEISAHRHITGIDLYGGELSELDHLKLFEIYQTANFFTDENISVVTNLERTFPLLFSRDVDISFSWIPEKDNFEELNARLRCLSLTGRSIGVTIVYSRETPDPEILLEQARKFTGISYLEVKPMTRTMFNQKICPSQEEYWGYNRKLITKARTSDLPFNVVNSNLIEPDSTESKSTREDHVFISPYGKFGTIVYVHGYELFVWKDSLKELLDYEKEYLAEVDQKICKGCKKKDACTAEHRSNTECLGGRYFIDRINNQFLPKRIRRLREISYRTHRYYEKKEEVFPKAELFEKDVVEYFYLNKAITQPAKAYAVAIIYAKGLEERFGVDFFDALNSIDLLAGDDHHFVRYLDNKPFYDAILLHLRDIGFHSIYSTRLSPAAKATAECFREEFMVGHNETTFPVKRL